MLLQRGFQQVKIDGRCNMGSMLSMDMFINTFMKNLMFINMLMNNFMFVNMSLNMFMDKCVSMLMATAMV